MSCILVVCLFIYLFIYSFYVVYNFDFNDVYCGFLIGCCFIRWLWTSLSLFNLQSKNRTKPSPTHVLLSKNPNHSCWHHLRSQLFFCLFLGRSYKRGVKETQPAPKILLPSVQHFRDSCTQQWAERAGKCVPPPPPRQCTSLNRLFHPWIITLLPLSNDFPTLTPSSRPRQGPFLCTSSGVFFLRPQGLEWYFSSRDP